jgi:hypothetical protein
MSEQDFTFYTTALSPDGSLRAIWKPQSKRVDILQIAGGEDDVYSIEDIELPADKEVTHLEFDSTAYVFIPPPPPPPYNDSHPPTVYKWIGSYCFSQRKV